MSKRKGLFIVGIVLVIIGGFYLKDYLQGKSPLTRYNREIKGLQEDLKDINSSIDEYYKRNNLTKPSYFYLAEKVDATVLALLTNRYEVQSQLATYYQLKGDYYLKELYRKDKDRPRGIWKESFRRYDSKKLLVNLKAGLPEARDVMTYLIQSRKLALKNYDLACDAVDDKSSDLYLVRAWHPEIILNPLVLKKEKREFIQHFKKNKAMFRRYISQRVKASTHFNKGLAFRQLAGFAVYSDPGKVANYLLEAEREFWLAVGVDELFHKGFYFIAESYFFDYEQNKESYRDYNLIRALKLLESFAGDSAKSGQTQVKDLFNRTINKDISFRMSRMYKWKSQFLLGRVYMEMANLSRTRLTRLRRKYPLTFKLSESRKSYLKTSYVEELKHIMPSRKGLKRSRPMSQESFLAIQILRLHYLDTAKRVYKNWLMGEIPEKSPLYKLAAYNYSLVRDELKLMKRGAR